MSTYSFDWLYFPPLDSSTFSDTIESTEVPVKAEESSCQCKKTDGNACAHVQRLKVSHCPCKCHKPLGKR